MQTHSSEGRRRFTFGNGAPRIDRTKSRLGDEACVVWYLDDTALTGAFITSLPREVAALEDVACTVYLADRLARRPALNRADHEDGWARELDLRIPVADLARWCDDQLKSELRALLWLQIDDRWNFQFVERQILRSSELVEPMFRMPLRADARAALFSGGLDSLAGLCIDLASRPDQDFVVVSVRTNGRVGAIQDELMSAIRDRFGRRRREVVHVAIEVGFGQDGHQFDYKERSQRSRREGRFQCSCRICFMTKAQMCTQLADIGFGPLAGKTISCDGFPQRVRGQPQCGLRGSCLLRRRRYTRQVSASTTIQRSIERMSWTQGAR